MARWLVSEAVKAMREEDLAEQPKSLGERAETTIQARQVLGGPEWLVGLGELVCLARLDGKTP